MRHSSLALILLAVGLAVLRAPSLAQGGTWEETWHEQGEPVVLWYGSYLTVVGDLDGDGIPEFAVTTGNAISGTTVGKVYLYSGATGQVIYVLAGSQLGTGFGCSVLPVADQDGDGVQDLLIGESKWIYSGYSATGRIGIYSGRTGTLLGTLDGLPYAARGFGLGLAHAGDLDQDGRGDFLVHCGSSRLAISGRTGAFLWGRYPVVGWSSPDPPFTSLGSDVDGDGVFDVVEGDPDWPDVTSALGIVRLLSGVNGSPIWESAPGTAGRLGFNLAVVGDLDGDAVPDILAGEMGRSGYPVSGEARALVLSGFDGSILRAHDSPSSGEWMGYEVGALGGSWDSDNIPDYVVATPWYSNPNYSFHYEGKADVYSGADGQLLVTFYGTEAGAKFGWRCGSLGDLDADGFPELLIGAFLEDHVNGTPNVGGAHMFSFRPLLTVAPSNLSLSAGTPSVAALDFPLQEAAWPYAVLASATGIGPTVIGGVEVPLSADPLLARMVGGWTPPLLQNGQGILDGQGDATALIHPSPALAAYLGRTFWIAAVSWDPGWGQVRLSSVARPLTVVP